MRKNNYSDWKIRAIGVIITDGKRIEKPLEDFTQDELREISIRKNEEALMAAGYRPVKKHEAVAI